MKILLVNPPYAYAYGKMKKLIPSYPPLGLAYLASALENYDVTILDMSAENMDQKKFKKYIKRKNLDIAMFTATTPTIDMIGKLCRIIKQCSEDITTVVGGSHPTALPERTLKENKSIDIVVIGEGEETAKEMVNSLSKGEKLNKVKGICFRRGEKIIKTRPRPFIKNLDSIKFPRHDMLNLKSYEYWLQHGKKIAGIITSRGCPYRCTFCCRGVFGQYYRFRTPRNVIEEIKWLDELGVDEIHILDDNFTFIKKRSIKILNGIRREFPNLFLSFINGVRVDRVDKDILLEMKRANTYYLGYGIESGSQKILDSIKKGISLKQVEKTIKISKKIGIETLSCFFIIGLPEDTRNTIKETINFAKRLKPDFVKFSTFVPYPGTELYEKLKRDGRIITEDWRKYGTYDKLVFEHPNISDREFQYWQKKAYIDFYSSNILSIIKHFACWPKKTRILRRIMFELIPDFINFTLF